jgi:hypothetical protein
MVTLQLNSRLQSRLGITPEQLAEFCQRWQVSELALFGSVLRNDFSPDSDIDVLVPYHPTAKRGLFEKISKGKVPVLGDRVPLLPNSQL